jgi:hypothetical protein
METAYDVFWIKLRDRKKVKCKHETVVASGSSFVILHLYLAEVLVLGREGDFWTQDTLKFNYP